MSDHSCHQQQGAHENHVPACHGNRSGSDWFLRVCLFATVSLYLAHFVLNHSLSQDWLATLAHSVFELVNTIWWGVLVGVLMISALGRIPREFVMSALGTRPGAAGVVRATLAGVLLDLCSHGILMVGAKLYERGASTGQVMAFLVASPWNSFSLTLILIALIGLPWTLGFILFSMLIAVVTGLVFDSLVGAGVLPGNPQRVTLPGDFKFWPEARNQFAATNITGNYLLSALRDGLIESKMVLRWILFGVLLASAVRAAVPQEVFSTYFGPSMLGLGITLAVATLLEVCSEGSTPIAADILNRAGAPGNSFAFLMGGVSTDYTEIMVLRDCTGSLKVALFLPLITVPQVILLAWLINQAVL